MKFYGVKNDKFTHLLFVSSSHIKLNVAEVYETENLGENQLKFFVIMEKL